VSAYNAGDYVGAVEWWRRAAEQGHRGAQYSLGVIYDYGFGVLQDKIAAHMWFNIAATNGDTTAAVVRGILAKARDIVKALKRAKRCMSSGYKECD